MLDNKDIYNKPFSKKDEWDSCKNVKIIFLYTICNLIITRLFKNLYNK